MLKPVARIAAAPSAIAARFIQTTALNSPNRFSTLKSRRFDGLPPIDAPQQEPYISHRKLRSFYLKNDRLEIVAKT
ncbi:hypothetical protein GCM10009077_16310 [Roseibium denhamense]